MNILNKVKEKERTASEARRKPRWAKLDIPVYRDTLRDKLAALETVSDDLTPLEVILGRLYDILSETALELAPPDKLRKKTTKIWTPELSTIAKHSKEEFRKWVADGRSGKDSESYIRMKEAKATLRRTQRNLEARKRENTMSDIMRANMSDQTLFYNLIRRQRGETERYTSELIVEGETVYGDDIKDKWADYFEQLATPKDSDSYERQYKQDVELKVLLLADINSKSGEKLSSFTEDDVRKAVTHLKAGKAMDDQGLAAEHIRYGGNHAIPTITKIINRIIHSGKIPEFFKSGLVTPVYKKNKKPINQPDSYRRITITSIVGKIVERLIAPLIQEKFTSIQSRLQRGFTAGVSCTNAALLLSEAISEAHDNKSTLWMTMFDASKAFDVVWQNSLMLKLHDIGVSGDLWNVLQEWYRGQKSSVKWRTEQSKTFPEQQGVRQGGILSPDLYKMFINPLLKDLENSSIGFHIGATYVGVPTCADDMTVLSTDPVELQTMIDIAESFANKERYKFNTTKTKVMMKYGNKQPKDPLLQEITFNLYDGDIEMVNVQPHLGIDRYVGQPDSAVIVDRIQCARRTAYALMKSGFHGLNGLGARSNCRLWNVYIVPRLLYGLEVLRLTKKDIKVLETYQTKVMKQLQHLPTRTSTAATLLLVGQLPAEAALDRRILSLFGNAIRSDSVERDILERQYAMKTEMSDSWTATVTRTLEKYSLPSIATLMEIRPSKDHWKGMVKETVFRFWTRKLTGHAKLQSSLKYLNVSSLEIGKKHQVWETVSAEPRDTMKAALKAKLLTGTYTLQVNKAIFNQYQVDKTCPLCGTDIEDRQHFVLECQSLHDVRAPYLTEIQGRLSTSRREEWVRIGNCNKLLLQLILDCSAESVCSVVADEYCAKWLECTSRRMCYALHCRRAALLKELCQ